MFSSVYFIISRRRAQAERYCLPRLGDENRDLRNTISSRAALPTELHNQTDFKTANYELYTECHKHTRLYY
jgi:hypothetical protein